MSDPNWLALARTHVGVKEYPGSRHNDLIIEWFEKSGHGWIKDDETAWCAAFMNAMFEDTGYKGTGSVAARSFRNWGKKLSKPRLGCVAIFKRGNSSWQGHVALYLGETSTHVRVLGGNQRNSVSVAMYSKEDLLEYRWPDTLAGSKVIYGSTAAAGGGLALVADSTMELTSAAEQAEWNFSAGNILGIIVGVLVLGGAIMSIYSRWDAAGRPVPSWMRGWFGGGDDALPV